MNGTVYESTALMSTAIYSKRTEKEDGGVDCRAPRASDEPLVDLKLVEQDFEDT